MSGDAWIGVAVGAGLKRFYATYAEAVDDLTLRPLLRKCNPWRLRALGIKDCDDIVQRLVEDHMSSSAETKFGDMFIETMVEMVPGVRPSPVEGADFEKGTTLISVKSGANWGNAAQWKALIGDTVAALNRYKKHPGRQAADFVLGISMGRGFRAPRRSKLPFKELRGQRFWTWVADDEDVYQKIMAEIDRQSGEYEERRRGAVRRLREEMHRDFGLDGGLVNWSKLNAFVNAEVPP